MKTEFIEIEKALKLENSMGWLSNYWPGTDLITLDGQADKRIEYEVRVNGERSEYFTKLLERLGQINEERESLLGLFRDYKP